MKPIDFILILVVAAILAFAVWLNVRRKRSGGCCSSCSGNCSSCPGCENCSARMKEKYQKKEET